MNRGRQQDRAWDSREFSLAVACSAAAVISLCVLFGQLWCGQAAPRPAPHGSGGPASGGGVPGAAEFLTCPVCSQPFASCSCAVHGSALPMASAEAGGMSPPRRTGSRGDAAPFRDGVRSVPGSAWTVDGFPALPAPLPAAEERTGLPAAR